MRMKLGYKSAWSILLLIAVATATVVFIPIWLIQPFAPQTERSVELSYHLRTWSPTLTLVAALAAIGLSVFLSINSRRWFGKVLLFVPLFVVFAFGWLARQNHFEWMFNPLMQSSFARVSETDFVDDEDMVLAVNIGGEAVAYPVRQMAYHHVVSDVVGGRPITATY